jgi:2'-5' RNA ligase
MRLFIAIDLPDPILDGLDLLFRAVPVGRPCSREQLHLTLFFLGDVPEKDCPPLIEALRSVKIPAFALRMEGVGCFPSPHRPRILWAGLSFPAGLHQLKKQIDSALLPLGFAPEKRPFHPHLTLARIKNPRVTGIAGFLERHREFLSEEFPVNNFYLYSSKLAPRGAVYTKVETFGLN